MTNELAESPKGYYVTLSDGRLIFLGRLKSTNSLCLWFINKEGEFTSLYLSEEAMEIVIQLYNNDKHSLNTEPPKYFPFRPIEENHCYVVNKPIAEK